MVLSAGSAREPPASARGAPAAAKAAAQAGIAKSTFYFHFEDKGALLAEALHSVHDDFLDATGRPELGEVYAFAAGMRDHAGELIDLVTADVSLL